MWLTHLKFPRIKKAWLNIAWLALWLMTSSTSQAICVFSTDEFKGELTPTKYINNFPTQLITLDDNLSNVFLSCQDSSGRLEILPPVRSEDDSGPDIKTKPQGYFIYQGKRYNNGASALIVNDFTNRQIKIGMTQDNEDIKLPAGTYSYIIILKFTAIVDAF